VAWHGLDLAFMELGERFLSCESATSLLFTENETNSERLFGTPNRTPYVKDGIDRFIVHGRHDAGQSRVERNEGICALSDYRGTRGITEPPAAKIRPVGLANAGRVSQRRDWLANHKHWRPICDSSRHRLVPPSGSCDSALREGMMVV
jgi:hypothetical protein